MFEKIKRFIELGLWNEKMLDNVFQKGAITFEEYKELEKLFM